MHANAAVTERLQNRFEDGPPTDATVRGQGFDFLPAMWNRHWPADVAKPTFLQSDETRPRVSRQDVFDRASSVESAEDAVELYALMGAWGTGTKARSVIRTIKPLREPGAADALLRAYTLVRTGDTAEAYRRLAPGGPDRVKYLGPAFFTKWLYFSAYDTWQDGLGPAPLILDRQVARALGWTRHWGWSANQYLEYLDQVEEIREHWAPDAPSHCVEYALFASSAA